MADIFSTLWGTPGQDCSQGVLREGSFVCCKLFLTQSLTSSYYLNSCAKYCLSMGKNFPILGVSI